MIKNRAASVRARLKQHSDTTKQDFNLTLTHFGLERLLYRLSISEHGQNFLLKGAFGDAVTPAPESISYPVLLNDLPAPRLRAYSKYTVVAEKFNAICTLGMANSRMKDYFDLWVLLHGDDLDPTLLRRAIEATRNRRRTPPLTGVPVGLTDDFATDARKQTQWRAFLKKNGLEPIALNTLVRTLREVFRKIGAI